MDKASSLFLDQFAVDKLLSEKLEKVSHMPGPVVESYRVPGLDKNQVSIRAAEFKIDETVLLYNSPVQGDYTENNICRVNIYPVEKEKEKDKLIFVHGLYEESRSMYQFLFSLLNKKGYTIYLYILPYHYERKPGCSFFSGEYFWSANFERSITAVNQTVEEIYLLYRFLKETYHTYPHLCGFSMGGAALFNLAAGTKINSGVFLANPVIDFAKQIRTSRLWCTIKEDYKKWGVPLRDVEKCYSLISPLSWTRLETAQKNIMVACGEYDQLVDSVASMEFFDYFESISKKVYKCGHLNTLRVPRLADDIDLFFSTIQAVA